MEKSNSPHYNTKNVPREARMKKVLIAGGSGMLGEALSKALSDQGHQVSILKAAIQII